MGGGVGIISLYFTFLLLPVHCMRGSLRHELSGKRDIG